MFFLFYIHFLILGLVNNINGSHAASPNPYIYGLHFTALAYRLSLKDLEIKDIFMSSNPLILPPGPIPVYWESIQKVLI